LSVLELHHRGWVSVLTNCTAHLEGEEAARDLGAKAIAGI